MQTELDTHQYLLNLGYRRGKFAPLFDKIQGNFDQHKAMHLRSPVVYAFPNHVIRRFSQRYANPAHFAVIFPLCVVEQSRDAIGAATGYVSHTDESYFYHLTDNKTHELVDIKRIDGVETHDVEECNVFCTQIPEEIALDFSEAEDAVLRWLRRRHNLILNVGPKFRRVLQGLRSKSGRLEELVTN